MSPIEQLLASLDAEVHTFSICKIQKGWALSLDADKVPAIHYGLRGCGIMRFPGGSTITIEPHDFVLIPRHQPHRIDTEGNDLEVVTAADSCIVLAEALLEIRAGSEADLMMVWGKIAATYAGALGLFDSLTYPVAVRLRRDDPLRQAFEIMLRELASPTLGTRAMADALLKQCLVLLVRRMAEGDSEPAWLAGMVDSRLAAVVTAVLENPGSEHTLNSLARQAGMSRSGFALRFASAFGMGPMQFVNRVRLRYAAQLLRTTELPISVIANRVGYASRTHFSRSFRAAYGKDPQSFRTDRRDG